MENKEKDMKQLLTDEELMNVSGGTEEDPWKDLTWEPHDTTYENAYCNQYSYPKLDKEGCDRNHLCQWFPSSYGSSYGYCLQVRK